MHLNFKVAKTSYTPIKVTLRYLTISPSFILSAASNSVGNVGKTLQSENYDEKFSQRIANLLTLSRKRRVEKLGVCRE